MYSSFSPSPTLPPGGWADFSGVRVPVWLVEDIFILLSHQLFVAGWGRKKEVYFCSVAV